MWHAVLLLQCAISGQRHSPQLWQRTLTAQEESCSLRSQQQAARMERAKGIYPPADLTLE